MPVSTFPSRKAFNDFRTKQIELGFEFPLTATSIGREASEVLVAHVRRISLMDRAAIGRLDPNVQEVVWQGLKAVREERRKLVNDGNDGDPESLMDAVMANERVLPAADAYCVASFITPRLFGTETELSRYTGEEVAYLVTDLAAEDRVDFFMACSDADHDGAKKLKLFRASQESAIDVEYRPESPVAAPITFGGAEPQG